MAGQLQLLPSLGYHCFCQLVCLLYGQFCSTKQVYHHNRNYYTLYNVMLKHGSICCAEFKSQWCKICIYISLLSVIVFLLLLAIILGVLNHIVNAPSFNGELII